jgi:sterol desaturase/sphingolipid hydroxylase (fatty acid hydroxylase superfamily)
MTDIFQTWHQITIWVGTSVVTPVLWALNVTAITAPPDQIAGALLISLVQVAVIAFVFQPLEAAMPAEDWPDRKLANVDRLYTLIMRLGLLPILSFLVLLPLGSLLIGAPPRPESGWAFGLKHWVPWFQDHPFVLMVIYYLLFDFVYYWMHRAQHVIPWWWALHSMHHSQRQMSCWSNDRGSYLDAILQSVILAGVGFAVGVEADEFALLTLVSELAQNFSHANVE